ESVDRGADHRAERERDRRPQVELLYGQRDEQASQERSDDRPQTPGAELPARAVGAQRRWIDERAGDINAGLDAEHAETREKARLELRGLRRVDAPIADGDHYPDTT